MCSPPAHALWVVWPAHFHTCSSFTAYNQLWTSNGKCTCHVQPLALLKRVRHCDPPISEPAMSALHEALAASLAALAEVEGSCASYPCATSPVESPAASWAASESHEVRKFSKRPWTAEEDEMLRTLVEQHGPCRWPTIASQMNGRAAKQCRERWLYHLDKSVKKEDWTAEEDERLTQLIETHGPKWSHIKAYLPGRMDNAIKNRWSLILRAQRRTQAQAAEGASEVSAGDGIGGKVSAGKRKRVEDADGTCDASGAGASAGRGDAGIDAALAYTHMHNEAIAASTLAALAQTPPPEAEDSACDRSRVISPVTTLASLASHLAKPLRELREWPAPEATTANEALVSSEPGATPERKPLAVLRPEGVACCSVITPEFKGQFKEIGALIKDICANVHHLTHAQIASRLHGLDHAYARAVDSHQYP